MGYNVAGVRVETPVTLSAHTVLLYLDAGYAAVLCGGARAAASGWTPQ